jgi:hypothetical protein
MDRVPLRGLVCADTLVEIAKRMVRHFSDLAPMLSDIRL